MIRAQVLGELIVGFHCCFHTRSYQQCKVSIYLTKRLIYGILSGMLLRRPLKSYLSKVETVFLLLAYVMLLTLFRDLSRELSQSRQFAIAFPVHAASREIRCSSHSL
jgi:hypothetical protein